MSHDAENWTKVAGHAPWGARAWAAGAVYCDPDDPKLDVGAFGVANNLRPKIILTGGVYYGTKSQATFASFLQNKNKNTCCTRHTRSLQTLASVSLSFVEARTLFLLV